MLFTFLLKKLYFDKEGLCESNYFEVFAFLLKMLPVTTVPQAASWGDFHRLVLPEAHFLSTHIL